MRHVLDTFDVAGRTTIRSGDGVFFQLPDQGNVAGTGAAFTGAAATAALPEALVARVRKELQQRRQAGQRPVRGRDRVAIVAPEGLAAELLHACESAEVVAALHGDDSHLPTPFVLHVAASPSDRSRFDQLPAHGTPVLRCYREGDLVFMDPLALDAEDPKGSQVLRRRLAASPAATELKAWLDTQAASEPFSLPEPAMSLFLARLLAVIKAWQLDSAAVAHFRRTLWRLDTLTLITSEHPVLPFPEPAILSDGWLAPQS